MSAQIRKSKITTIYSDSDETKRECDVAFSYSKKCQILRDEISLPSESRTGGNLCCRAPVMPYEDTC